MQDCFNLVSICINSRYWFPWIICICRHYWIIIHCYWKELTQIMVIIAFELVRCTVWHIIILFQTLFFPRNCLGIQLYEMAQEIETSIPPLDASDVIQVKDFYKGRNVFITGSTGFMGKVLVEKLLWDCEDIGNLYLLVRPKKGESVQRRVDDMLKLPVW